MEVNEALATAALYNLEDEVRKEIESGTSPEEALAEWDIL